ncbi:DUF4188 domain-containing protein [Aquiluna borgnonia]|uniref:DUF4188 domain-containing protein n=1 Tax=Aquiluna borgnonia TaxID=2499157 RepID=A0A7D4UIK9_9MICO|nr:DUF4188 domain-containing protein [Aquiluna borgnonia]QKJ25660.1 DUF4188 domain-containing protein [Aquiluna borgnonia]
MAKVNNGRFTAQPDTEFVVFLIGMRINKLWAIHKWLPVFNAMPKMLRELHINRDLGFLSYQMWFSRTVILLQYWESPEKLMQYAKASNSEHLPAWKQFNTKIQESSAVGIWHETYLSGPKLQENIYVDMPNFGLGKAFQLKPVVSKLNNAEKRLKR